MTDYEQAAHNAATGILSILDQYTWDEEHQVWRPPTTQAPTPGDTP